MKKGDSGQSRRDFLADTGKTIAGLSVASSVVPLAASYQGAPAPAVGQPPRAPVSAWRIDPSWPKHPAGWQKWAGCPEVKVDAKDQVWVTTRRYPAVEIYTPAGSSSGRGTARRCTTTITRRST